MYTREQISSFISAAEHREHEVRREIDECKDRLQKLEHVRDSLAAIRDELSAVAWLLVDVPDLLARDVDAMLETPALVEAKEGGESR